MTDERPRTRAEERIAELDTSPEALTGEVEELRNQLLAAEQEAADNKAGWQRTAADFQNYKRRTEQDRESMLGLANEALLSKLLTIADDFDRAIEHMPPEFNDVGWVGWHRGYRPQAAAAPRFGGPDAHRGSRQAVRST